VKPARDLVAVVIELAAGVEHRDDDFRRGLAALVAVGRDAAAVVDHCERPVDVDRDVDLIAVAGQGLVDGVVDDLVNEMVQAGRAGGADVHRRPLAHGLEPLEHLDLVGGVVLRHGERVQCVGLLAGAAAFSRRLSVGRFGWIWCVDL
jgi:hypothetical protein